MSKIFVLQHVTLDGVMQAPGRADEDVRGGFSFGGWAQQRGGDVNIAAEGLGNAGALLLGRHTYEGFYDYWPKQQNNPFTDMLNNMPKYVASTSLEEPLPWQNSILIKGDVAAAVASLKARFDKDLLVMGSGKLLQALMPGDLIDEYVLMIHPIVLGTGAKLFAAGSTATELELLSSKSTPSGLIIAHYRPSGALS